MLAIFTCCLGRRRSQPSNQPDERTYLIPTEPQPATIDDDATRRQRALQDRLTDIVRAKEGKMVNLHARLPFNLHNRNLSATLDPSSSRSASDSLLVSPTSPRYPITYSVSQTGFYSSPLGDLRHPSASRSSSVATDPEGTGHRDARDGDEDGEGGGGDTDVDAERSDTNNDRTPILNLRLVNPGCVRNALATRGRSLLKYSNGGPQGQVGEAAQAVTSVGAGTATATGPGPQSIPSPPPESDLLESVTSPSSTVVPVTLTPRNDPEVGQPQVSISPASTSSFKIQETAPLVIDWET